MFFYCAMLYLCFSITACSQLSSSADQTMRKKVLSDSQPLPKRNSTADYRCDVEVMTINDDPENNELMGIRDSWLVKGCDKKLPSYIKTSTLHLIQHNE